MQQAQALIVDDEPDIRELIEITLGRMGVATQGAENLSVAHKLLSENNFDLCLTDMRLPDGDGLQLVEHVQQAHPDLPIAVITAHGNMETAITALKNGAFDFVSKPIDIHVLRNLIQSALDLSSVPSASTNEDTALLLGQSEPMKQLKTLITKVARSQAPVHIYGESGSGKELVAKQIHQLGPRAKHPFIAVNCGAIPSELMESEFFGHKKGSFTGAHEDKLGLFQAAQNGTLFLDEVADLPLSMQVKLLRAIQEKAIRPVGEQKEIPINVRILSATHNHLHKLVEAGDFRQDLFYRINVIEIHVPSLRERGEDIDQLIDFLIDKIVPPADNKTITLSNDARQALKKYAFPGNVRELENILERATTLCENNCIETTDLCLPAAMQTVTVEHETDESPMLEEAENTSNLENYLDTMEKDAIVKALEETRWNKTAAAKKLGITFRALRYRLKKLGLE